MKFNPSSATVKVGVIEISDDSYIIKKETADHYLKSLQSTIEPETIKEVQTDQPKSPDTEPDIDKAKSVKKTVSQKVFHQVTWTGEMNDVNSNWMKFYRGVLAKFISPESNIRLTIHFEVNSEQGFSQQSIDEAAAALRDLGLNDSLMTHEEIK